LRSWNHFREPARALDAIIRALRPNGTLTIVDNVAFGLVRSRAQAGRAEQGAARFEHYRNDDAEHAFVLAHERGLELLERRDVGSGTSNQWLLRFTLKSAA
jgi:SAM-dependent methyltransferase